MTSVIEQEASSRLKHKKKDLISLVWPTNMCYSRLINGVPKEVTVDLVAGTWTFDGRTEAIGSRRRQAYSRTGDPIGVYDRTKFPHLESFKDDCEWVRTRNSPAGD